jgi:hypothetical protein
MIAATAVERVLPDRTPFDAVAGVAVAPVSKAELLTTIVSPRFGSSPSAAATSCCT